MCAGVPLGWFILMRLLPLTGQVDRRDVALDIAVSETHVVAFIPLFVVMRKEPGVLQERFQ